MDTIDVITQYILAIVPAVVALVGMAVTIGVGVGKIKHANRETIETVFEASKENRELKNELAQIAKENREIKQENKELKKSLNKITARMEHLYYIEENEEKE